MSLSWGLAALAALLPTYLVRFSITGIPTTLLELLVYALAGYALVQAIQVPAYRQRLMLYRSWLIPAGLLLGGAILGVLVSPDTRQALGILKGFIVDPLLVYLIAIMAIVSAEDRRRVLTGLILGGVVVAGWGIVQSFMLNELRALGPYRFDQAASANYLALALASLVPLSLMLPMWGYFRLIAPAILLVALVLTGSRAGVGAGILGLAVAGVLSSQAFWRERSYQLGALLAVVLLCAGSWLVVRPDFTVSGDAGGRLATSNNIRFEIWGTTSELIRMAPVTGLGLGNYQRAFDELTHDRVNYTAYITPNARTAHNLLIGIWTEAGLLGLLAIVGVLVLVGTRLVIAVRHVKERSQAALLAGAWTVLLAQGLVDMPIWKNDLMIVFWLLAAVVASLPRKE
ncbi:MAG: O-antigen ligase family protein [Patescibacteria group bacterium]|mgnify:CR=1 FL=1